ncbi:AAA family ATPase [Nocardiopsis alba]|uniref:helix-turn-helix transcriptional regulator n=1 Tax=Nocardiopsis alba TaxID=53437 RepID=UPI0038276ED5
MSPIEPPTALIGRRPQLETLLAEARSAAEGSARTTLLCADAGIGKTRLLTAYLARTPLARSASGGCLEMGTEGIAYAPFTTILRRLVRDGGPGAAAGGELARLVPALGEAPGPTEESRARLFEAVLTFLEERSRPGGLAVVLEDLHWADTSTRDLLVFLLRNLDSAPLHLLVSVRTDDLHRTHPLRRLLPELQRLPGVSRMGLAPLDVDEVAAQAAALGHDTDPGLLHARSGGNPLFVESLLADPAPLDVALPEGPRELLLRSVEGLPGTTRAVLGTASAAGVRVEHALLTEVAAATGVTEAEMETALRPAVDARVLGTTDTGYVFRHSLLAEAVYADLLPGERVRIHHRYADALDRGVPGLSPGETAGRLARHAHAVHDHPRALVAAWRASGHAAATAAHPERLDLLERVLELWESVPDAAERLGLAHGEVLRLASRAAHVCGSPRRAIAHATTGLEATDPEARPDLVGELLMARGRALSDLGRLDALEDLRAAAGFLGHGHPRRAVLDAASATVLMRLGRDEEAERAARTALSSARREGDRVRELDALMTLANLLGEIEVPEEGTTGPRPSGEVGAAGRAGRGGGGEPVIAMLRRAVELARDTGRVRMELRARRNLAAHLDHELRPEEAYREAELGWERCVELGISRGQGIGCATAMASLLNSMGRLDEAEELLARLPRGRSRNDAYRLNLSALFHTFQGRWERAEEALTEFTRIMPRDVSSPMEYLNHHYARLYLSMYRGEPVEAARIAMEAHEDVGLLDPGRFPFHGLSVVGELILRLRLQGDPEGLSRARESTALLRSGLDHVHDRGRLSPLARLGRTVMEGLVEEDPARSLELLTEAAEVAEAGRNRGMLPQILFGAFHAALALGDRGRARSLLERHASHLGPGAGRVVDRDAELMRASLEAETSGKGAPAGLTSREVEVLVEVAKGSSNREIGRTLFISPKTVSVHVTNLMAKLGVDNRTAAAAKARELGLL